LDGRSARRWAGGLIAALVVALGILCLVNGVRRIGQPFPGFLLAHNGIVVSIGRSVWHERLDPRIPFSQVVGVVGTTLATPEEIQASAARLAPGEEVAYRFRKAAEVFDASVPVRLFSTSDFLALFANYFLVGLTFSMAGLWVLSISDPRQPAPFSFFVLCQICALVFLAAGDVYGPYWFTEIYFTAHSLAPAALLHFASAFPEPVGRRGTRAALAALVYGAAALLAAFLNLTSDSPSLFLPLIYTVNLLLANGILLYGGRLLISRYGTADPALRRTLDLAVAGVLLAASLPAAILVVYPVIQGLISPLFVVAPLVLFPLFTAVALRRAGAHAQRGASSSVRVRLSLLFLAAVQTGFLAAIAYFWLSASWQQLLADLSLHQRQQSRLEHLQLGRESASKELKQIEDHVEGAAERAVVRRAREALGKGDLLAAGNEVRSLSSRYLALGRRLEERRGWLSRMDAALVLALVLVGILQAVAFTLAVRRWLIQPIEQLSGATSVIATGDLSYRSRLDSSDEFAALAESINRMAASLAAIRERVDAERTAREEAAAAARDSERRRLARELHDGVLQDLSAVKLALEGEARRSAPTRMDGIIEGTIRAIVDLRRVVDDLRPPDLSHVTLGVAIGSYVRAMAERQDIHLEVDLSGAEQIADWAARDVYRIAQEAVTNALRHGAPSCLAIRLSVEGPQAVLEVRDDGPGFDPATAVRGSGLAGMAERAAAIGARLEVRTHPGSGTTVHLTIPLFRGPAMAAWS
jgi:signal transduction histidine kinase